jgi:C4-dicarboxylate transporter DctQ subunit
MLAKLNKFEEGSLGVCLLGLAILTFVETALRYTVNYTFTWFQEFSNYMIIVTTFLGASIGAKYGMHFSMEAITQYAPDRASHLLKASAYFISGAVVLLFIYFGALHIFKLQQFGVKSAAMQIPMFIPYIAIPLFSIPMAIRFFAHSLKHFRSFMKGEPFERVRRKD